MSKGLSLFQQNRVISTVFNQPGNMVRHLSAGNLFFKFFYLYGILIGAGSNYINVDDNSFYQTRFSRIYAAIVNVLTVAILPWGLTHDFAKTHFGYNWFAQVVWYIDLIVLNLANVYSVVSRYSLERKMVLAANEMVDIEKVFLNSMKPDKRKERYLLVLYHVKMMLVAYITFGEMIYLIWVQFGKNTAWHWYLLMFLYINAINVLPFTTLRYFSGLWIMCRDLYYTNKYLEMLIQEGDSEKMTELRQVYWRLLMLNRRWCAIYRWQMLASRCTCFISLTTMGYYCSIVYFTKEKDLAIITMFGMVYIMMVLDITLVDTIYVWNGESFNETLRILREADDSKEVRDFAMSLLSFPMIYSECGLYEVGKSLWFRMMATITMSSIMLVQFHMIFENLSI